MAKYHCDMFEFAYKASLHISHPTIDPNAITTTLGITPSKSHCVGDRRSTPRGNPLGGTYPSSYWTCSLDTVDGEGLEQFLCKLIESLSPFSQFLNKLAAEGGNIECFSGISAPRNCDQLFASEVLSGLGQLGIDLRLDIYGHELPQEGLEV